jgi:hypothetical protein
MARPTRSSNTARSIRPEDAENKWEDGKDDEGFKVKVNQKKFVNREAATAAWGAKTAMSKRPWTPR